MNIQLVGSAFAKERACSLFPHFSLPTKQNTEVLLSVAEPHDGRVLVPITLELPSQSWTAYVKQIWKREINLSYLNICYFGFCPEAKQGF